MAKPSLTISSRNYSSWSLRGRLLRNSVGWNSTRLWFGRPIRPCARNS